MIRVTDYITKRLVEHGATHVFMISGGGAMYLVDSVGRQKGLTYTCPHHEQAAAIAAEGYARASGKLGVAVVTTGPGGTNTITGVTGQWLDSLPCLYISGQVRLETTIAACPQIRLRQLGDQEINIVDVVKPITKYAVMVQDPHKIKYHLDKAIYLATHGRPGPVWIDVPLCIQAAMIDEDQLEEYDSKEDELLFDVNLIRAQVKDLIARFEQCSRPVLLAGQGIRLAGATGLFEKLVAKLNVPVLTSIGGNDSIWSDHPLFFGRPGICGDRVGNMVLQNSDLFLSIGSRLGIRVTSYNYDAFARGAFRAMVNIDEAELQKPTLRCNMAIHSDAGLFIEEMLCQLGKKSIEKKKEWLKWCGGCRKSLPGILDDNPRNPKFVNFYVFADELFKQLKKDDLVVTGNGTAYTATYQIMRIKKGMRVFANQGCASMGYDLPAAVGASFARNKGPVVLITGDGSIQMNIQELQTIAFHKLPIKVFVLNNGSYLSIRITQDAYFDGRHIASCPEGGVCCPDICKIAKGYGIKSIKIKNEKNLPSVLKEILHLSGPVICEIMMDPSQTLYPKLSSERKPDGRLISKPLEDMYPFLDRELFRKTMIIKPLHED